MIGRSSSESAARRDDRFNGAGAGRSPRFGAVFLSVASCRFLSLTAASCRFPGRLISFFASHPLSPRFCCLLLPLPKRAHSSPLNSSRYGPMAHFLPEQSQTKPQTPDRRRRRLAPASRPVGSIRWGSPLAGASRPMRRPVAPRSRINRIEAVPCAVCVSGKKNRKP